MFKLIIIFSLLFFTLLSCIPNNISQNEGEKVDVKISGIEYFETEIFEYFSIGALNLDSMSSEQAALGRLLFYDTKLSKNDLISCASCHKQNFAFSDNKSNSPGFKGDLTIRNSIALVNVGFQSSIFWDVSGDGLEFDVLKPITNHIEMGMESLDQLEEKLTEEENYQELFAVVFGSHEITQEKIGKALSQFVAALISYQSKYDEGTKNDFVFFTNKEKLGKELYFGKALCSRCHNVPFFAGDRGVAVNIGLDLDYEDQGSGNGKFKVPTLRNIAQSSPYMHDGRFQTLNEVVEHYNNNIQNHLHLSSQLKDPLNPERVIKLDLSEAEKEALISFLGTLTDFKFINDVKFSNPY